VLTDDPTKQNNVKQYVLSIIDILLANYHPASIYSINMTTPAMCMIYNKTASQLNKAGLHVRMSIRLSTKSFSDFNEIWYIDRGQ